MHLLLNKYLCSVVQALVSKREDLDFVLQTIAVFSKWEDPDFHFIFRAWTFVILVFCRKRS
jgi:hypothetical protein